jgi:hypothetical protein
MDSFSNYKGWYELISQVDGMTYRVITDYSRKKKRKKNQQKNAMTHKLPVWFAFI